MVAIEPFGVEEWMNAWETKCEINLAETCVSSLTIGQMLELVEQDTDLNALLEMRLTYGAIEGSARLKAAIAALYAHMEPENILVSHGAIGANALVYHALLSPGDRLVSFVPTYQQHYSIGESLGAEVVRLPLVAEDDFLPDFDALRAAVEVGTKLIALTNPNNPTGALLDRASLEQLVAIAKDADAWVLCDEVYRGTEQDGEMTPSIADLYNKGISTGSVSKAFSLAGLRVGWIAGPREILQQAMVHRDYSTISVGRVDEHLAALALESADQILQRSRFICQSNLAILDRWVAAEPMVTYVRPKAGTTALLRLDVPITSEEFCIALQQETGVMLLPGSVLNMEGYVRIGYAFETDALNEALARVSGFLRRFE